MCLKVIGCFDNRLEDVGFIEATGINVTGSVTALPIRVSTFFPLNVRGNSSIKIIWVGLWRGEA